MNNTDIITKLRIAMTDARQNESHFESWMILNEAICDAIDALAEQPAQQEPVAEDWSVFNTGAEVWSGLSLVDAVAELTPERMERGWSAVCVINKDNPPLYTSPPAQRKPLTVHEIAKFVGTHEYGPEQLKWFRLGEAAHGIKENT